MLLKYVMQRLLGILMIIVLQPIQAYERTSSVQSINRPELQTLNGKAGKLWKITPPAGRITKQHLK